MTITLLGVDTGGTFTDFVCIQGSTLKVHKLRSTPDAPQEAILQGIDDLGLTENMAAGDMIVVHGTTVATNAVLEGKGVKTVYIGNRGLKDILRIGRQARQNLYELKPAVAPSLFEDELMLEVSARVDATGLAIADFEAGELKQLKRKVDQLNPGAIAINLLFSFLSSEHEEQLEALFRDDYFVSRSSTILPEYREYERGMTTWINAWIGPLIRRYIGALQLELKPSKLSIMQSSGLSIAAPLAADRAVNLLLSGPAGGLAAAQYLGNSVSQDQLITFDMGGTSTDVSLIDGRFKITNSGEISGYPIGVPMADIHTIGAGGGSIAHVDAGGLLQVGPESAGATPGPACYGDGGQATVTDANLVLGRLQANVPLAGGLALSVPAAQAAILAVANKLNSSLEATANGIINLANEHMSQALRLISIQRGYDPRKFALMCFGGAGGLHLCDLAESLEMRFAIVPIHAGVLSALGLLTTKPGRALVRTKQMHLIDISDASLRQIFQEIEEEALLELRRENVNKTVQNRSLDLRYYGQTYTINVPYKNSIDACRESFHQSHEEQYGHRLDRELELLNCRLHIEADRSDLELPHFKSCALEPLETVKLFGIEENVKIMQRSSLSAGSEFKGPALIVEDHATTLIKPGWQGLVDEFGNLRLERPLGLSSN